MPTTPDIVGHRSDAVFFVKGTEAPIVSITSRDQIPLADSVETKVLLPGPKGSLLEFRLYRGQSLPTHRYAQDSIYYLVAGGASVMIGRNHYQAAPRDAWAVAAGASLAIDANEDSIILEWMSAPHLVNGTELISWGETPSTESHLFSRWQNLEAFHLRRVEGETEFSNPGDDIQHLVKVMVPGPYGAMIWNSHKKGKWALHTHYHHWVVYLVHGKMREVFGGEIEFLAGPGDIWAAQAGAEHCTEALEDNEIVEFKWPAPMLWSGVIHSWDPKPQSTQTSPMTTGRSPAAARTK